MDLIWMNRVIWLYARVWIYVIAVFVRTKMYFSWALGVCLCKLAFANASDTDTLRYRFFLATTYVSSWQQKRANKKSMIQRGHKWNAERFRISETFINKSRMHEREKNPWESYLSKNWPRWKNAVRFRISETFESATTSRIPSRIHHTREKNPWWLSIIIK